MDSSTSSIISNDENVRSSRFSNKTRTRQGCEIFPSCFMPSSPGPQDVDSGSDSGSDNSDLSSIHGLDRNDNNYNGMESNQRYGGNRRMEAGSLSNRMFGLVEL
ncbi:hypothetical protein HanOQP8_Chr13g0493281 [Helianthus annuus]|nr:hypothetical protein HanOQP8_Chr13g0493281 [Helianthus annuus]